MTLRAMLACGLLGLAGLATPASAVTASYASDGSTALILALRAYGSEASLAAFEKAAEAADLFPDRSTSRDGEPMVLLTFMPSEDGADFWPVYRKAKAGKFGALRLELVAAPMSEVAGGGVDPMSVAKALSSSAIVEPRN